MSADLVGEDSVTAVIIAAWQHKETSIVSGKDDIGGPPKAKRLTVKPKTAADMA